MTSTNTKDLPLGVPVKSIQLVLEFIGNFITQGGDDAQLEAEICNIVADPSALKGKLLEYYTFRQPIHISQIPS